MTSYFWLGTIQVCATIRPLPAVSVRYIACGSLPCLNFPSANRSAVGSEPAASSVPWQLAQTRP